MDEEKNFLENLEVKPEDDLMNAPLMPEKVEEEPKEEDPSEPKERDNREARRAKEALRAEREANRLMAEKLDTLTDLVKSKEGSTEYEAALKIWGTEAPENLAAGETLKSLLKQAEDRAYTRAVEQFKTERAQEAAAVTREEHALEEMLDTVEDKFGVTIDSATEKQFYQMLERRSPKDADGNIIAYADPISTYEDLMEKKQSRSSNTAKDLSTRSMVRSSASPKDSSLQDEVARRLMEEAGII